MLKQRIYAKRRSLCWRHALLSVAEQQPVSLADLSDAQLARNHRVTVTQVGFHHRVAGSGGVVKARNWQAIKVHQPCHRLAKQPLVCSGL